MIILATISIFFLLLLLAYAILLDRYRKYFGSIGEYLPTQQSEINVSVIIPARNESDRIGPCLQALHRQSNAPFEILVIDDHSTDGTADLALQQHAGLISMKDQPAATNTAFKKMALATGIKYAKGDMILTTDADCIAPPDWTNIMAAKLQETNAVMVAGPVRMIPGKSFLSKFQSIDFAILQGITAASVHAGFHDMSSGANLGYLKRAFEEVGGFDGIDDIATGDDILLMQKFSEKFPGRISYAFSPKAIMDTEPEPTWQRFIRQRIRWASKARRYRDKKIFYILILVYLMNVSLLALMLICWLSPWHFAICLAAIGAKTIVEWGFVHDVLKFFGLTKLLAIFPLAQPFHVVYTVLSGTFGQAGAVEWKGRKVK